MSLYNPAGLLTLSAELMGLSRQDAEAARVKLAGVQETMRTLIAAERAEADAATGQLMHRIAIARETVVVMVLRSFPWLPETSVELQRSFLRLARSFSAINQPVVAGWALVLAQGRPLRFVGDPSCQIAVQPAMFQALLPAEPGWFVEIGANDGATFSNTASLVDAGWSGLYAEPHPNYLALCRSRHAHSTRVRFEACAVGRTEGQGMIRDAGLHSRVAVGEQAAGAGEVAVTIVRLDALLEKHGVPPGFELLVIDVEGDEEAVLAGFDLARWRPRVVIIEIGDFDLAAPPSDPRWPVHQALVAGGYAIIYQDNVNSAYIAPGVEPAAIAG